MDEASRRAKATTDILDSTVTALSESMQQLAAKVTINGVSFTGTIETFNCDVCGAELSVNEGGGFYCPVAEHGYAPGVV